MLHKIKEFIKHTFVKWRLYHSFMIITDSF